jgi:hypothetical protein
MRYFQNFRTQAAMIGSCNGTTQAADIAPQITVLLRASPTVTCSGGFVAKRGTTADASSNTGASNIYFTENMNGFSMRVDGFDNLADNAPLALRAEGTMTIDAEL